MQTEDWAKQYQQEPDLEKAAILRKLAQEYHERTEAYDRTVCTGPITPAGYILPMNAGERKKILAFSQQVRQELIGRLPTSITRQELAHAISHYDP